MEQFYQEEYFFPDSSENIGIIKLFVEDVEKNNNESEQKKKYLSDLKKIDKIIKKNLDKQNLLEEDHGGRKPLKPNIRTIEVQKINNIEPTDWVGASKEYIDDYENYFESVASIEHLHTYTTNRYIFYYRIYLIILFWAVLISFPSNLGMI